MEHRLGRRALTVAATPCLIGSVLLMRAAGVGVTLVLQQVAMFTAGAAALWVACRRPRRSMTHQTRAWLVVALVASLVVPLIDSGAGPHRWLSLGGARLYVAPVVLPLLLWLTGHAVNGTVRRDSGMAVAMLVAALALAAQPDAAQAVALGCAGSALACLWRVSVASKAAAILALIGCALGAVRQADPLAPVLHVEGVFRLAAREGTLALAAAVCVAVLPTGLLLWHWWRARDPGHLAVAAYYAALLAQAPAEVTPVPLLGFGASHIVGYFVVATAMTADERPLSEMGP